MIKVIEGHRVKPGADIQPIFRKFRSYAIQCPGFISAENLVGETDGSVFLFVSTWDSVENWLSWETSRIRADLYKQSEELLADQPKANIYRLVPTHW
jgi:heme-degrading monooxygenase HmoA